MSNKNYRTLDGLYKALLKRKKTYSDEYTFRKEGWNVIIFNSEDIDGFISGLLIEDLMPVLKRSYWMISYSQLYSRMELVVWVDNDNK